MAFGIIAASRRTTTLYFSCSSITFFASWSFSSFHFTHSFFVPKLKSQQTTLFNMLFSAFVAGVFASSALGSPLLEERGTCTFTDAKTAMKSKKSCSKIYLKNIAVPAGTTLDMTGLASGTQVSMGRISCRWISELSTVALAGHLPRHDDFRLQRMEWTFDLLQRHQHCH